MDAVTVLIDLPIDDPAYVFTIEGLGHALAARDPGLELAVTRTDEIGELGRGVLVAPGSPYRDPAAAEHAVERCRLDGTPLLGTCGGFQHLMVEHARNVMGIVEADHAEYGGEGIHVVELLSCSLAESQITIELVPGTRLATIYGERTALEKTNCNYGLAAGYQHLAAEGGLVVSSVDETGEVRSVERSDHPFFVGTLFQPQRLSTPARPHPVLLAFIDAMST
jgi:CTP synthase (UTP-ammonia lyase)